MPFFQMKPGPLEKKDKRIPVLPHILSAVISKVEEGTFFSTLHLLSESSEFSIDARPSDAVAIAVRAQVPIYVKEEVLHQIPDHPDFKQLLDSPEETDPPE